VRTRIRLTSTLGKVFLALALRALAAVALRLLLGSERLARTWIGAAIDAGVLTSRSTIISAIAVAVAWTRLQNQSLLISALCCSPRRSVAVVCARPIPATAPGCLLAGRGRPDHLRLGISTWVPGARVPLTPSSGFCRRRSRTTRWAHGPLPGAMPPNTQTWYGSHRRGIPEPLPESLPRTD